MAAQHQLHLVKALTFNSPFFLFLWEKSIRTLSARAILLQLSIGASSGFHLLAKTSLAAGLICSRTHRAAGVPLVAVEAPLHAHARLPAQLPEHQPARVPCDWKGTVSLRLPGSGAWLLQGFVG